VICLCCGHDTHPDRELEGDAMPPAHDTPPSTHRVLPRFTMGLAIVGVMVSSNLARWDSMPARTPDAIQVSPEVALTESVPEPSVPEPTAIVSILFKPSSSEILPRHYADINVVGQALTRHPEARIRIEGHSDDSGLERNNRLLSEKRAESVKQYLVKYHSIDPQRLIVNWLRVLGTAKPPQIDQGVRHQFHAKMSLLNTLKPQKQPLEFVLPRKGPVDTCPQGMNSGIE
jgi:OmpA family